MGEDSVMARFTIEDEALESSSGFTIDDATEARPSLTPEQIARASGAELPSPGLRLSGSSSMQVVFLRFCI